MALLELKGELRAKRMLCGAYEKDRIPSSYLFCGPDTHLMKRFAIEFAKLLDHGPECPSCQAYQRMEKGVHPDLMIVVPEGKKGVIKMDAIRRVKERIQLGPAEAKRLVVIFENADMIETSAANSFLKMLEEPPDKVLFILITSKQNVLPLTVSSRCQKIHFSSIPQEQIEEVDLPGSADVYTLLDYSGRISSGRGEGERKAVEKKLISLAKKYRQLHMLSNARTVLEAIVKIKRMGSIRLTLDSMALDLGRRVS